MWEKDKVPVQKMLREICDEKFSVIMDWCTKHLDGMSKRIGSHLHQIVLKSTLTKLHESVSTSEERLMASIHREVQQCQDTWRQSHESNIRDQVLENHSLQLEIHRRSIKSRARKIVQPDPASWQLKSMSNLASRMTDGMVESQPTPSLFYAPSVVQKSENIEYIDAWGGSTSVSRAQTPVV